MSATRPALAVAILLTGCASQVPSTDVTVLSIEPLAQPAEVAGGEQYTLTVDGSVAGSSRGADGEVVTFSSSAMGSSFSPASAVLDSDGRASTTIIVPYGTALVGQATTADGGIAVQELVAPAVSITLVAAASSQGGNVAGELIDVTATASGPRAAAAGMPLSFATSAMGVAFAPAMMITAGNGQAVSHVFVPFNSLPVSAIVTGGGGTVTKNLVSVSLSKPTIGTGVPTQAGSGSGTTYPVTVIVEDAGTNQPIAGINVTFSAVGTTCVPAVVATDSMGSAVSQVFVVSNTEVVASAGGAVSPVASVGR